MMTEPQRGIASANSDFEALCREYDALVRRWFSQTEAEMARFRELEQLIRKHSAVKAWRQYPALESPNNDRP